MKIMVVDDSKAMRLIVTRTLRQAGFSDVTIVEAEHGKAALDAIVAGASPDLVLCDWNMPEMLGIDLLRALRAASNTVPFVFVTSEGTKEMRDLASQEGAAGLIAKPFTADTFKDTLGPLTR